MIHSSSYIRKNKFRFLTSVCGLNVTGDYRANAMLGNSPGELVYCSLGLIDGARS